MTTFKKIYLDLPYYFFNGMINIKHSDPNLLSIDKYHTKILMLLSTALNIS